MENPRSPESLAELLASVNRKKQDAVTAKSKALLATLTTEQFNELMALRFTYTLTLDEYRAMFE